MASPRSSRRLRELGISPRGGPAGISPRGAALPARGHAGAALPRPSRLAPQQTARSARGSAPAPEIAPLRPLGRAQTARVNARQAQALAQARASDSQRLQPPLQRGRAVAGAQAEAQPEAAASSAAPGSARRASGGARAGGADASSPRRAHTEAAPGSKRKPDAEALDKDRKGKGQRHSSTERAASAASQSSSGAECCPVCLGEMEEGEHALFITSCGHRYHFKCLRSCLLNKTTNCPVCRREFASMTPPLQRPRPRGRSIASIVERNAVIVCSGAPVLEHTVHEGNTVQGMLSVDELGRILPIPPDGFIAEDMRKILCLTKIHVTMPPSSFWQVGEAPRELFLTDLSGVSELQREVLEQTAARLTR